MRGEDQKQKKMGAYFFNFGRQFLITFIDQKCLSVLLCIIHTSLLQFKLVLLNEINDKSFHLINPICPFNAATLTPHTVSPLFLTLNF